MEVGKILVPLDGSAMAEQVLPYAADLARRLDGAVHLVTVVTRAEREADVALIGPYAGPVAADGTAAAAEERSPVPFERAEDYASNLIVRLHSEGVQASYEVRTGATVDELLAAAHEHDIGLIAIASRGRSGLPRAFFGSVADELLRRSGLPVLVVKPEQP